MAINLRSLNLPEATLIKPEKTPLSYRLNTDKIKENWDEIKADSKCLGHISLEGASYESSVPTGTVENTGGLKQITNYSLDAFFRKDMPKITTDGKYMVGGETFTEEELQQCRMVMKSAVDGIGCGIGKGINIDYRNYAQMGIAVSTVKTYAAENLTEEQAAVVNKAMQSYNEALINLEKEVCSGSDYVQTDYECSEYYGLGHVLSDTEIDFINEFKEEITKLTGKEYEPTVGIKIGVVGSATNQELIGQITDLFSNMDSTDEKSIDAVMARYRELIKPAYIAKGWDETPGALTRNINQDIENFKKQMTQILIAANYHATDYSI